jgi:dienelactone hydrolase
MKYQLLQWAGITAILCATVTIQEQEPKKAEGEKVPAIEKETLALFEYDDDEELLIEERGFEMLPGYSQADLTFASPAGGRVPAYLYIPDGDGPHAGILLMHGMPGDRESSKVFAPEYVKAGAVVLAISAPWARPDGPREEIITFTRKDYLEQIQLIQDLRRGIDLLLTLPEVDPERLAYAGGSYGGAMGGLLAGVERRLKAYVLLVGDGGLIAHFTGPDDQPGAPRGIPEKRWLEWKAMMTPIEPIRFVAHAAPAHLLFQNGRTDELVPAATAEVYQKAGSEPKTVIWYDGGHAITPKVIEDQMKWLAKRIGIDAPD